MHSIRWIFVWVIGTVTVSCGQELSPTRRNNENTTFAPGEIIWQDEFDSLDKTKWSNEINVNGGYNNEFQIYDDYGENGYVRDGVLYIRPTLSLNTVFGGDYEKLYNGYLKLEGCTDYSETTCTHQGRYPNINPPIVSQRLRTKGLFSFRYGRVVARARMPSGDWTWPAIWMLPELDKYGGWPMSGEIDIVETRGNRKLFDEAGTNIGSEQMGVTMHFGPKANTNGFLHAHGTQNTALNQGFDREFHIYEMIWNTEMVQYKLDGVLIKTVQPPVDGGFFKLGQFPDDIPNPWTNGTNPVMAPFDENFHLLVNVATGGNFFNINTTPPKPWGDETAFLDFFNNRTSWMPTWSEENAAMAIDYIRVYAV